MQGTIDTRFANKLNPAWHTTDQYMIDDKGKTKWTRERAPMNNEGAAYGGIAKHVFPAVPNIRNVKAIRRNVFPLKMEINVSIVTNSKSSDSAIFATYAYPRAWLYSRFKSATIIFIWSASHRPLILIHLKDDFRVSRRGATERDKKAAACIVNGGVPISCIETPWNIHEPSPGVSLTAGLWNFKPSLPTDSLSLSLFIYIYIYIYIYIHIYIYIYISLSLSFSFLLTFSRIILRNANFLLVCPELAFGLQSRWARARTRSAVCPTTCIKTFERQLGEWLGFPESVVRKKRSAEKIVIFFLFLSASHLISFFFSSRDTRYAQHAIHTFCSNIRKLTQLISR